ncbi:uncharacterized protein LY89DRAFT_688124, partial [Mollisia scopiformis]
MLTSNASPKGFVVSKPGNGGNRLLWCLLLGSPEEFFDFLLAHIRVVRFLHSDTVLLPVLAGGFVPVRFAIVNLWHTISLKCRNSFGHC